MSAGVQTRSSTSLRLVRTWFSTWSHLFTTWASMAPGLFLNFPPTSLIFHVSSARVSLEKVDDFSGFPRKEVVK
jgi:hypothetical protein